MCGKSEIRIINVCQYGKVALYTPIHKCTEPDENGSTRIGCFVWLCGGYIGKQNGQLRIPADCFTT